MRNGLSIIMMCILVVIVLTGCKANGNETKHNKVLTSEESADGVTPQPEVDSETADAAPLLSDGQYHPKNWKKFDYELMEEAQTIRTLERISKREGEWREVFTAVVLTGTGEIEVKLQRVKFESKTVVIPQDFEHFPLAFAITPDGEKLIIYSDNGLWLANSANNQLEKISSSTYGGKSYEALVKESIDLYEEPNVSWNSGVIASPDSATLVYQSNKNDIAKGSSALFAYDLVTGAETLLAYTAGAHYLVEGWLNEESIICTKYDNNMLTKVLVNLQGQEMDLDLAADSTIYAVQEGFIAYINHSSAGGEKFHIASVDKAGIVHELTSTPMEGTIRIRSNTQGFSPDLTYIAFLYVPNDEPEARLIKVVNLKTSRVTSIDSFPEETDASAAVLEFSWINDDTLFIAVQEDVSGLKKVSNWTYALNG